MNFTISYELNYQETVVDYVNYVSFDPINVILQCNADTIFCVKIHNT